MKSDVLGFFVFCENVEKMPSGSSECPLTPNLAPDAVYGGIGEAAVIMVVYTLTRLKKTKM